MSLALELTEGTYGAQLLEIFPLYQRSIAEAEPLFELEGERLERIARTVPKHQSTYAQKALEMKGVMKWLENYKGKLEAIHLKNYNKGQRALSVTDQKTLTAGEPNMIELNQLIIEAATLYGQLTEITEAFKNMGWMVGHITKLRVAELGDIIL
jgi:hypothetical protein